MAVCLLLASSLSAISISFWTTLLALLQVSAPLAWLSFQLLLRLGIPTNFR